MREYYGIKGSDVWNCIVGVSGLEDDAAGFILSGRGHIPSLFNDIAPKKDYKLSTVKSQNGEKAKQNGTFPPLWYSAIDV